MPTVAPEEEPAVVDAILRYYYYIEMGVDPKHVAPYQEEWLGNALSMVPAQPPPNVSQVKNDE